MEVGTRIREQRESAGISQEELARQIFVSRQTVSNWETGKTYPDVQSLLLLSNLFGVSVDHLVKGDAVRALRRCGGCRRRRRGDSAARGAEVLPRRAHRELDRPVLRRRRGLLPHRVLRRLLEDHPRVRAD